MYQTCRHFQGLPYFERYKRNAKNQRDYRRRKAVEKAQTGKIKSDITDDTILTKGNDYERT